MNNMELLTTRDVHCKAVYRDQTRRFSFTGTEFTSLKALLAKLYSTADEFVLKYRDDEDEFVTLESQEDYLTALEVSPLLLRLRLVHPKDDTAPSHTSGPCRRFNHHRRGDRSTYNGGQHGIPEHRKQRLEKKLAWIEECLAQLPNDDSQLSQKDLWRKQHLVAKHEKITLCLAGKCPRQQKLTPECLQQLEIIKTEMWELRKRMRELKHLNKNKCDNTELLKAIKELKEKKELLKVQRRSLFLQ